MNQMLKILYDQIVEKLDDDGISIEARNLLIDIKTELAQLLKLELTLEDMVTVEIKLKYFTEKLKSVK